MIHKIKKKSKIFYRKYANASETLFRLYKKIKTLFSKKRFQIIINDTKISAQSTTI